VGQYASYQDMAEWLWYSAGREYASASLMSSPGRKICYTDKWYIGLAPLSTQIGDHVYILNGGGVPYFMRPCESARSGAIGG
jgi:hypothetical protein